MPSPQSLVTFLVMLASLLLVLRTQIVLKAEYAAGVSIVVAFLVAWFVDTRIPPDDDEEDDEDLTDGDGHYPDRDGDGPDPAEK